MSRPAALKGILQSIYVYSCFVDTIKSIAIDQTYPVSGDPEESFISTPVTLSFVPFENTHPLAEIRPLLSPVFDVAADIFVVFFCSSRGFSSKDIVIIPPSSTRVASCRRHAGPARDFHGC